MESKRTKIFLLAVVLLTSAVSLLAHHGNAAFDSNNKVTVKGTVTEWFWANPHCFLKFDVKDEHGEIVHWVAETSNPPDMINAGWRKESLRPGDEVTVTMIAAKNGKPIGRVQQVVLANGQILNTRQAAP